MANRFFQPSSDAQPNRQNLLTDILRFIRDALTIANACLDLKIIEKIVKALNQVIGDHESTHNNCFTA
jgi:hypothetical protein